MLDKDLHLNSVNQAFKDIAGIAQKERRSDKQNIYLPDLFYDPITVRNILQQVLQSGKQAACDLRLASLANNEERWLHCLFSIVKNDQDESLLEGLVIDITERTFEMERILFESQHDALTQLLNRRAGKQLLAALVSSAAHSQGQVAILLIDLDGFKSINDNNGHEAGDTVLIEAARRMQSVIRKEDILIRLGGDEFVIAFSIKDGNRDEVDLVVTKLRQQFSDKIMLESGQSVTIGASIGIALFPQDGENLEVLMATADSAMYRIKKKRKARTISLIPQESAE